MSCSSAARRHGPLGDGDRLPVVGHQRPLAPGQRDRGERLGLAHQHLVAAARRRRSAAARAPARPAGSSPSGQLAVGGPLGGERRRARRRADARPGRARPRAARTSIRLRRTLARRGASSSPSASSSRRSGSRSSNSRNDLAQRASGRARARCSSLEVDVDVDVADRGGELLRIRASSAWLVRFSLRLAPEISSMLDEHPLEVAELLEQLRGGLVADAGDAGDVVRGVALQAR